MISYFVKNVVNGCTEVFGTKVADKKNEYIRPKKCRDVSKISFEQESSKSSHHCVLS